MQPALSTCASSSTGNSTANGGGGGEIILFGVRLVVDSMRKSVSLNNLSQYEQHHHESNNNNTSNKNKGDESAIAGYVSADDVVPQSTGNRERKRGVPWTEEEHKLFLLGLQKVGKGDWRGISRNFVKTRTPTQVASHAQKYFLRRSNLNRRRRRSSLFDITTDTVASIPMEEERVHPQDKTTQPGETNGFPMAPPAYPMTLNPVGLPVPIENSAENLALRQGNQSINNGSAPAKLIRPVSHFPDPQPSDLNLNLNLSLQPDEMDFSSSSSRHSAFQVLPNLSNGDGNSIISVA
ncbi:hypothetical protein V6N13_125154 [Hibiscus sabdariffa]|uniref:Uncharacterized protein n=1 Tax=Hibiscus sabdariffa TaxID=183260 RepID=A0ABR2U5P0_9ROSI